MHNAVMCTLSLYDVIGITRHLHIKLKSFSNIAQPLHKEAVRHCSFSLIIAKKSLIMIEACLVDVSILFWFIIYKVMKYIKILIIYNAYFKKAVFHSRENIKSCIFTAVKI